MGFGWVVMALDYALTLALVNLALLVALGALVRHLLLEAIEELDFRLAQALQGVLESLPLAGAEPPNPIQQMLLGILQQNMAEKVPPNPGGEALKAEILESKGNN